MGDKVAEAAADLNPWNQLVAGCATFLKASTEPQVQQIMLIDAPAVLGWGVWRELDAATSMQYLEDVLTRLGRRRDDRQAAGETPRPPAFRRDERGRAVARPVREPRSGPRRHDGRPERALLDSLRAKSP